EHHGTADAAVCDSLGSDLQRFDHHRADSAGIERSEIPPDERRGAVAPEPFDIRPWRHRRAVYRDLDHRRGDSRDGFGLVCADKAPTSRRTPRRCAETERLNMNEEFDFRQQALPWSAAPWRRFGRARSAQGLKS